MTLTLVVAAIVGAGAWGAMFALPRDGFWRRAAAAGVVVGAYAVAVQPARIGRLLSPAHPAADVGVGLAAAAGLYATFWVGLQALVVILPALADEVADLYDVRGSTRRRYIPLVLVVTSAGEELFFRGLWQARAGFWAGLAVYGAVHLWERKWVLIAAALLGGACWGGLLAWTGGLVAPLVSHLAWGLAIIFYRPARPTAAARRLGARLRRPTPPA